MLRHTEESVLLHINTGTWTQWGETALRQLTELHVSWTESHAVKLQ